MTPFRFTLAAEDDLGEIEGYLSARSETAAERVLSSIEATCRLLGEHPDVGRHRNELGPGVMSILVGAYVLFYEVAPSGIVVLRIIHGHRDIPNVF